MNATNEIKNYYLSLGIKESVYDFCEATEQTLLSRFQEIDRIAEQNQIKVISAMQKAGFSESHLNGTTGYGYNDRGREAVEEIYAHVFHTEDALVRQQITCGTHALSIALSANLRPGDEILSPVGTVYDTLEGVIGIRESKGSLAEFGISFRKVDLLPDGSFDYDNIRKSINDKTKLIEIQRSKGYDVRPTLSVEQIGELISFVKSIKPDVICMVDNCYGEFLDIVEPTNLGVDIMAGSLIKNPGGGLALTGGYVCGRKDLVENVSYRMTCPGIGAECGLTFGQTRTILQGLFLAPKTVNGAGKGAILCAAVYEMLGYPVCPGVNDTRSDIIQAVQLGSPEAMVAFCEGIQFAAPIDSHVAPVPWAMPGYEDEVIMAAGAFVQGSSIELSADGPIREPYNVYFQGGLTYEHSKFGVLKSVNRMYEKGIIVL